MSDSLTIKLDVSQATEAFNEISKAMTTNTRKIAYAGAQVLYEEVLVRVPVISKPKKLRSGQIAQPGTLKDSIYRVFSKDNSSADRSTYHVSWNHFKAPHGHLVEYGTSKAAAHPFLRPSYEAKRADAEQAMRKVFANTLSDKVSK